MAGEIKKTEKKIMIVKPVFTLELFMKIQWIKANKKYICHFL